MVSRHGAAERAASRAEQRPAIIMNTATTKKLVSSRPQAAPATVPASSPCLSRAFRISPGSSACGGSSQAAATPRGEALAAITETAPDVVLMDINLPGASGVEATRRASQIAPGTAVLVVTTVDDDDTVFAALAAGARGYVLKGASADQIPRRCARLPRAAPPSARESPPGSWPARPGGCPAQPPIPARRLDYART